MSFAVNPADLSGYARQLGRAGEDAEEIRRYIGKYSTEGTGGELFAIAKEGHDHAVGVLDETFGRLTTILSTSSPEVAAAAAYYVQTDVAAAAVVDATLPPALGRCPTPLEYEWTSIVCPPAAFADPRVVTDRLAVPPEPDNPSNALGFMDYVSPSSWAMKGFDIVLGVDPLAWAQEKLFGDWEALATMESVLNNASTGLRDLALNIQSGATTLHPSWQGNAGDNAYRYFTDLATAITALEQPIRNIGHEYRVMADAVWSIGEALGGVLKGLADAAIIAGIAAAAGTATSASGIGAVVGYGVAAVEVANMLRLWGDATKLYQSASAAILAFRSAIGHNLGELDAVTLPALPGGTAYDHPVA